MAAEGGLMSADVDPSIYDYCGGGIIAFDGGGKAESKSAEEKQRDEDRDALAKLWESIKGANRDAGAAIADVATLPLRGLAGAYDTAVVRPMRAAGVDAGYLSKHLVPEGVDPSSMTPFYDKYARGNAPKEAVKTATAGAGRGGQGGPTAEQNASRVVQPSRPETLAAGAKPAPGGAAPAGAAKDSGLMALLTGSPEWADLDAARKRQFEAPKLPTTAADQAAERAAHLKAQGITEMPWETAAKQTAELRRIMSEEDAARKKDREENERDERYRTFVAGLGGGSFGQSAQGGLRANLKREAENKAEDQRIKELRYNQNLKLNEIEAKAKELRYNEATGDVAAAQKNRKEIAELQRSFEKDKIAIAQGQAGIRERGLAAQLNADTQLKAASIRAANAGSAEAKAAIQALKAEKDSINARFAKNPMHQRTPQGKADAAELRRIEAKLAELGGLEATPVQSQYGPPPKDAVREIKR